MELFASALSATVIFDTNFLNLAFSLDFTQNFVVCNDPAQHCSFIYFAYLGLMGPLVKLHCCGKFGNLAWVLFILNKEEKGRDTDG